MKKKLVGLVTIFLVMVIFAGCSNDSKTTADGKEIITMWFWGAPPEHQETLKKVLIDKYNKSQNEYELKIEYRNSVDKDISVALSSGKGPDIVYGSGPSFVIPLAEAGRIENLDKYAEKYGWKDRILDPIYESGTVNGSLYSLGNSLNTVGIFYNKKVLKDNNWPEPKTVEELERIMDEAIEKGMYASVTGNKGWKPVNENYSSLFLTHFAGGEKVYEALTGTTKWTDPAIIAALDTSAKWYKKGYLAGKDYTNLTFNESTQLLADEKAPFFFGPSLVYQFAAQSFSGDKAKDLGFMAFPTKDHQTNDPYYTLGVTATLSINAQSKHKDEAAKILDTMMTNEFMNEMTKTWPGYWGIPLKDLQIDTSDMPELSKAYAETIKNMVDGVNKGHFGYYTGVFLPPATQQIFLDIESIWNEQMTSTELMKKVQVEFDKEKEKGLVPPIPKPSE
ncbi:ABC transporter substrate-binding protein [Peribacillus loiseleuriae]|uniref:ABC transporter substrate-binding protein n=1 Tax=Peribacillus loiseleuriae TaxID=1679170 RepID=A0A0K9GWF3_9BACI|nr:ABC transporter substrate-binding protein [Peribacillus loiseleuriae]KMY50968.1 ABC transporter substrate-binding protein [Peribacillus loiseleuriae]